MSKSRMVRTRIWTDNYFIDLDPSEKLLFLYLLTNQYTNISGIYEIPEKIIASETGFDRDMVQKLIARFEADNKLQYVDGFMIIFNWLKHQANNPSVIKGLQRELENTPTNIAEIWIEQTDNRLLAEWVQAGLLNLTILNLTLPNFTIRESAPKKSKPKKTKKSTEVALASFGEFENVKLTDDEVQKLNEKLGEAKTNEMIERLSGYIASKGKKYKSHYATIQNWARNDKSTKNYREKSVAFIDSSNE